jgi:Glycoside hydrolase 123, catalytic domain/Glycoside hydrolase 123 N-terminal domain
MRHNRSHLILLAFTCTALSASAAQPRALETWFVDALVKVFPSDGPKSHPAVAADFWTARNQHLSIELAVRSAEALEGVTAEVAPLKGAKGESLDCAQIRPVGFVVVGSHTRNTPPEELVGEAPGWFPDPLWRFPITLERRRTHSLWVTLAVPADATPGLYRGTIVVRTSKRTLARREFRVHVLAAVVPAERTLKVTNWFNLSDAASRQFFDAPQYSEDWWTLAGNFGKVMADHRQNMVITPLLDLIQPSVEGDHLVYDFTKFDRWVQTFQQAGAIGYIEGSHLLDRAGSYDAALIVPTYQIVEGKVVRQSLPPEDPRVDPFMASFLSALNSHLEQKGWKSIYYQHILDEAHGTEPPYYAHFADLVHRFLPGVLTMDAVDADNMPQELQTHCDIWVPQLGRFDKEMDLLRNRQKDGHEVWFYTCLFPNQRYPNRLMDYPLIKVRMLQWLNFRFGFTGFLHWGWNFWTPDPVNDTQPVIDANTELLPSGDAFIVYPDRANKSVFSSIRLETMREGIEDYELLQVLNQRNHEEADRLAQAAIQSFTQYVRSPAEFRKSERRLREEASKWRD